MIDYSRLPFSEAKLISEITTSFDGVRFTFHENKDERKIYIDLNKRLGKLETSLEMNEEELTSIYKATASFRVAIDEKEEVLLRINWLRRLYEINKVIQSVDTKEHAQSLRKMIASVQTGPLKNELMYELNSLVASMPLEHTEQTKISPEQNLMEKAIEEAGDAFINLGKAGRDAVITEVLNQHGEQATIEDVREHTIALEQHVESLTAIKESKELIKQLDSLPIPSFHALPAERKGRIVETLLENNKWNGLASLNRMIVLLDKAIRNDEQQQEEAKNTIHASYGKAAPTLNVKNVVEGRIQLS